MSSHIKEKFKIQNLNNKNKPFIKIPKIKNPFNEPKSLKDMREAAWNKRFIYNKIPNYDAFKDKNVLCNKKYANFINYKKIDNYLNSKSPKNYSLNQINIDNSNQSDSNNAFFFSSKTRRIETFSAKNKNFSFNSKNSLSPTSAHNIDLVYFENPNLMNLNNLWNELGILQPYRNYFNYIYKEVETEYKEELYQKEIEELNEVKIIIKTLKYYIGLRIEIIEEIKNMNEKLGKELVNKNNNGKEIILNEISDKIILLREKTINICQNMKKLKSIIFNINNLDKYNIDILSKKFQFDKNYVVKMKSELHFLKEGFAKYYFNIENDQTPFLLKASDKSKITKEDYFLRIIPLNPELKNTIIDCIFYIYQELIAYQNYNMNNKDFRRISPIKKKESHFNEIMEKRNINRDCVTDRDNKKMNGSGDDAEKNKGIESYIKDKKLKSKILQSTKDKIKPNGNNSFSNKNNLKKAINENIKALIRDTYDNFEQKKENYEKDQITQENITDSGHKNNLLLNDKNQSSFIKEEISEHESKTPFSSTDDAKNKLNSKIIETQIINKL